MTYRTVSTVFSSPDEAERATQALIDAGFEPEAISLLTHGSEFPGDRERIEEGTGWAAAFGALVSGLAILPALPAGATLFAAGPLAASMTAAASGAMGGGLIGALVGLGIPRAEAELYERRLEKGGIAVAVETTTEDAAREAEALLAAAGDEGARAALVVTKPRP